MGAVTNEEAHHHHKAQSPGEVNHRKISELIRDGNTAGALAALKKHFDDAVATLASRDREEKQAPPAR
jgi:DNA-binding GntR family transcriptional regulator